MASLPEIRNLDASAPITDLSTVETEIGQSLAVRRFQAMLLALFSILAVLLAAVGVFGLMAQLLRYYRAHPAAA